MDLGLALAVAAFALGIGAALLALAAGAFETPRAEDDAEGGADGRGPGEWAAVRMPDGGAAVARRA